MANDSPKSLTIRGVFDLGYTLVDHDTEQPVSGVWFGDIKSALSAALSSGAEWIYQQNLDARGRLLRPPTVLHRPEP